MLLPTSAQSRQKFDAEKPESKYVNFTPRPYQIQALDALHDHICTKDTNPTVVIPTGGGKSLMIAWAIQRWITDSPWFRCVILAHRKELISQNAEEMLRLLGRDEFKLSERVGIFSAALKRRDWDASILFASIDSIANKSGEFAPFDVIMIDEAHRIPPAGEGRYRTFLQGCRRFNHSIRMVGWTATPYRMGCGPICHKDHILQEICYEAKVTDLIRDGFLSGLRSKVGSMMPNLEKVKRQSGGDYVLVSLSKATNRRDVVSRAVREAVDLICREKRQHIIFFCVDVSHCQAVSEELAKYGIYAPAVTSQTKIDKRTQVGEDFKNGVIHAICNVNVYTEGFNATCVDCIVLLRPTLSAGLFSQMVGRGLRLHSGKRDCLVLDFAGCIDEHGPVDLLGGRATIMAVCGECRESFSRAVKKCPQCGWEIPKVELARLEEAERERRMHGDKASTQSILSGMPSTHSVDGVSVSRHTKTGKPDSIVVRYRCGLEIYREWICLDHGGYAGAKAHGWWRNRFGPSSFLQGKNKATVDDALGNLFFESMLKEYTKTITVQRQGKFTEIIGYNQPA